MKTQKLLLIPLVVLLAACSTIAPGNDPIIVNAERVISDARATFALLNKTEYETYSAIKAANPSTAALIRNFTNKVRANQANWLQSATDFKEAYAKDKSTTNSDNLARALSVLTAATAEASKYVAAMSTTSAWLSYQLRDHIGERK